MFQTVERVRVDKWLWAVRVYKTRALATEACRNGHVKIEGNSVKPSKEVKLGEVVGVNLSGLSRLLRVEALIDRRVGAALAAKAAIDLTPKEEYERFRAIRTQRVFVRDAGSGRPTKRERRKLEELL